jgi:membrane protein implicated in regulation of membrane protease activity
MSAWVVWAIVAAICAGAEAVTLTLILGFVAVAAVAALLVAVLGGPVAVQLIAFIVASGLLLWVVRPIAKKHLTDRTPLQLDGVETLIGRTAKVTRAVDAHGGRIRLGADEWTARTQHSGEAYAIGDTVRILDVDGATAVVGDALE